ncbi:MAG: DUF4296 domain-containing protein [Bacteroidetes bacterium]|nr:DUF4296 domain-containing protein [Bacteroidota bacterium]
MRFFVLSLLFSLFVISCGNEKKADVLPADKMQQMLTDIHMAEAYSTMVNDSTHTMRNKNLDSLAVYYKQIFKHYNITPEEFAKSVDWYKKNPEMLDSIYAKIIPELSKQEGIYSAKK